LPRSGATVLEWKLTVSQPDPLPQQLDSMRMAELVGREAPPAARLNSHLV
jgi:hypothetical protein